MNMTTDFSDSDFMDRRICVISELQFWTIDARIKLGEWCLNSDWLNGNTGKPESKKVVT